MENPNITMEEYIRLEEDKARRHGKVYNWETAKYVSSLTNNEIDFRTSFDESDDEDYTVIFDKNSFSYKIISINDLKMYSENNNEKVNMPSFPSPEPKVSCFDDLDFFKDFENEFPVIVYNDALTSKSEYLTEPTLCPQHIDKFDLKDETSLSVYDEVEQKVLYFNDLFPFNIIDPDNLKSDKDNDNNKIDIIQSSKDMALPPRDQRHQYLRFEGLQYNDTDIADFEERLGRIYDREVHRVQVFDFRGLTKLMDEGLRGRMLMEHKDAQGQSVFISQDWRRLFKIRGPLVHEFILEFFSIFRFGETVLDLDTAGALQFQLKIKWAGFGAYWAESARQILDKEDLSAYWTVISSADDFLGTSPPYTSIRDPMLRLCHRLIACSIARRSQAPKKVTMTDLFYLRGMDVGSVNILYLLAMYLRLFSSRRKRGVMISEGQFVAHLAEYFELLTKERLQGLTVIVQDLPVIDMAELVVTAGAPEATEDALIADEGALGVPAPVQAPQPPHLAGGPARTMAQRLARVEEDVHEIRGALSEQRGVLDIIARDFP
ncbi:hypothetical protein Tco_0923895 [Tanacetum coccineum]|uniref:Uncharacterized protein n=1 Tax=Tanacetum coccineum TaxID=301880 RepID=A0ABQ5D2D9_9ASTR